MVDTICLASILSERLGKKYQLKPLSVKCTYPVFCGMEANGEKVFVKLGEREEWERTKTLIKEVGECGLMSKPILEEEIEFGGKTIFVNEWKDAKIVFPEAMTEGQIEGFVEGCVALSNSLKKATCFLPIAESEFEIEKMFEVVKEYAERHPLAAKAIKVLMEIPKEKRSYRGKKLTVIHGDFHSKNFGFEGERMTAIFDFDKLTEGLGCSDFINALAERFSLLSMDKKTRRRLEVAATKAMAAAPYPKEEMEIAINAVRLSFAARRIKKHPRSFWVALDVNRRDKRIRRMLGCLKK